MGWVAATICTRGALAGPAQCRNDRAVPAVALQRNFELDVDESRVRGSSGADRMPSIHRQWRGDRGRFQTAVALKLLTRGIDCGDFLEQNLEESLTSRPVSRLLGIIAA